MGAAAPQVWKSVYHILLVWLPEGRVCGSTGVEDGVPRMRIHRWNRTVQHPEAKNNSIIYSYIQRHVGGEPAPGGGDPGPARGRGPKRGEERWD